MNRRGRKPHLVRHSEIGVQRSGFRVCYDSSNGGVGGGGGGSSVVVVVVVEQQ